MKKMWTIIMVMLLLVGCGTAETAETVADVWEEPVMAAPSQIRALTGFSKEEITVVQTRRDYPKRWEFAWATAGETGDRIGRGVIIDDGNYHYCLSTLLDVDAPESQIVWSEVFNSFELS